VDALSGPRLRYLPQALYSCLTAKTLSLQIGAAAAVADAERSRARFRVPPPCLCATNRWDNLPCIFSIESPLYSRRGRGRGRTTRGSERASPPSRLPPARQHHLILLPPAMFPSKTRGTKTPAETPPVVVHLASTPGSFLGAR
jgi:hypothetical protein